MGAVVLALVGAGLGGWAVFGPKGGADSPEAAVRQFIEAGVSQDAVGALDMINPGEVDGLDELYGAAQDRLKKEKLTSGDRITDALSIHVSGLDLQARKLGDSGARVLLKGGSYTVKYDPSQLPKKLDFVAKRYAEPKTWNGDIIDELGDGLPDANRDNDRPDPFLTTVKLDGRWYISALGTYLESQLGVTGAAGYKELGARAPDWDAADDPAKPVVAKDPEGVLKNLADAITQGDIPRLLANFPSDEVAGLRPYAKTYEDLLAQEKASYSVSLEGVDTDVDQKGDLTRLTIRQGTAYGTANDDGDSSEGSANIRGRCVTGTDGGSSGSNQFCLTGDVAGKTGIESYFLMLRKVEGGYQIDPMATAVEYGRTVIEKAPSSLIRDALDEMKSEVGTS